MSKVTKVITYSDKIWDAIVGYMPTLLSSLIVLFVGFYLIKLLSRLVNKAMEQREFDISLKGFIRSLINIALKIILLVTVAGMLGIHTTSFVAILGAAGLAIGLALQGSLSNFAGGVLILFFKPYKVGDVIEAGGATGKVVEIQIFNTILKTIDHRTIILPNGAVSNNTIINHTKLGTSRTTLDLFFDVKSDIEKIKALIVEIVRNTEGVEKDQNVSCYCMKLGIGFMHVACFYYTNNENGFDVKDVILRGLIKEFEKNGIELLTDFPDREPNPAV